jgi:copper chaperone CopZ
VTNANHHRHWFEGIEMKRQWELIGAFLASIIASVCCVIPLLLAGLGIGGAWIAYLTAFAPYRPIFISIALVFLGFSFYRVYRQPQDCSSGSLCANPQKNRTMKKILIVSTAFILGLLAFPYAIPYVLGTAAISQRNVQMQRVVLQVSNMTCTSCSVSVRNSLLRVQGVQDAIVTFNPPEAVIVYDPAQASIQDLIQATTNAGYPSLAKSTN